MPLWIIRVWIGGHLSVLLVSCVSCLSFSGVSSRLTFQPSPTHSFFPASCEMTNWSQASFIPYSTLSNSDFNSVVPSGNLEKQKRHSISINYHVAQGSAPSCSSNIMLENPPFNSSVLCGWMKAIFWPSSFVLDAKPFTPLLIHAMTSVSLLLSFPLCLKIHCTSPPGTEKMWIAIDSQLAT